MAKTRATKIGAGELTEQLTLLSTTPVPVSVTSLTRVGALATVTTPTAHGFTTGDYVTHAGAGQPDYNVEAQVTVLTPTTYTFAVDGTPATPATGTVTAVFTSDAAGGQGSGWHTFAVVWARVLPLSASEQLAAQAITAVISYKATIYYRAGITPKMRVQWTKYAETVARTLEIHGVRDVPDELRRMMELDLGEVVVP